MKRIGFYAGSFDPPTLGHRWMIDRALTMCDELVIGVGTHPTKKPTFSAASRIDLISKMMYPHKRFSDIHICAYTGATVIQAMSWNATMMFRGIRSVSDFDYELMQRHVNDDIARLTGTPPTTVFLAPPVDLAVVSSSMVKSLVGLPNWESMVQKYVSIDTITALKAKHENL
jgi:pantetheine-phosphate adenylyltransferase